MEPQAMWEELLAEALTPRLGREEARRVAALPGRTRQTALLGRLPVDTVEQRKHCQAVIRDQALAMSVACRQLHWAVARSDLSDTELGRHIVPNLNCVSSEAGRARGALRAPHLPCTNEDFTANLDIAAHYLASAEKALLLTDPTLWSRIDRERGIQTIKLARVLEAAKEIAIQAITHKNRVQMFRDEVRNPSKSACSQEFGQEVDLILTEYLRLVDALKGTLRNAEASVRLDREPDLTALGVLVEEERVLRRRLDDVFAQSSEPGLRR
jgi:hypothetical protein